jgi:hypothetical protein
VVTYRGAGSVRPLERGERETAARYASTVREARTCRRRPIGASVPQRAPSSGAYVVQPWPARPDTTVTTIGRRRGSSAYAILCQFAQLTVSKKLSLARSVTKLRPELEPL